MASNSSVRTHLIFLLGVSTPNPHTSGQVDPKLLVAERTVLCLAKLTVLLFQQAV